MTSSYPIPSSSSSMSSNSEIYKNTKLAINEMLKQFNDFTIAIDNVCNQASLIGRSLQTLEEFVIPEIIGQKQVKKVPSRKFKNSAHLMDSLDIFSKVMMSFSEKIKIEAIDSFDNFIVQAVLPNDDEIKGIHEHNSQIVSDFHESFFTIYNYFMVLAAELMEKFLICGNCLTPIGFPHKPLCLTKSLSRPNIWKKTRFDDKLITFGMDFCFNDFISPGCHLSSILTKLNNSCLRQLQAKTQQKPSLPLVTNSWPDRWLRSTKDRSKERKPMKTVRVSYKTHPIVDFKPSIGRPSIWTPTTSDSIPISSQIASFTFRQDGFN